MARTLAVRALVLLSCVLTLPGCWSSEKLGKEEPAMTTETLHSVVLVSGEEIIFDKAGGRYMRQGTLTGMTASGAPTIIPLSNVYRLRTWRPPAVLFDSSSKFIIAEVLLKDSTLLSFNPPEGRFDATKHIVLGRSMRTGETVGFPPSRVMEYRTLAGKSIDPLSLSGDTTMRFVEAVLIEPKDRLVVFDSSGGRLGKVTECIVGRSRKGISVELPLEGILYATVEKVDVAKTIVAVVGGTVVTAAVIVGIVAALKQSCPFLYSYDGTQYRFDAEPLGGATTEALARTDYSLLKYVQPVEGSYRLRMRNEVDETQYIDAIGLCIVDHDPQKTVVAAGENRFHLLSSPAPPISAEDAYGRDLLPFLRKKDGISWQTHVEGLPERIDSVRETLTLRFLKPHDATRAQLVVHGGTTAWGSNTIRLLYNLLGTDLPRWYDEADRNGAELYRTLMFLDSEELFTLRVYLQKNGSWVQRGTITGGGPFVYETQAVPLNVSGIAEDTLVLQVRPPLGFWSFDFTGIVYDDDSVCTGTEAPLLSATDQDGREIRAQLERADRVYFALPTKHQEAFLSFSVPSEHPGLARSVFVRTTGYYRLHLPMDHPPETAIMQRLSSRPGEVVRYSLERYREWLGSLRAQLRAEGMR